MWCCVLTLPLAVSAPLLALSSWRRETTLELELSLLMVWDLFDTLPPSIHLPVVVGATMTTQSESDLFDEAPHQKKPDHKLKTLERKTSYFSEDSAGLGCCRGE